MSEDDEQLRVRVAWLYFMEGLTQADIAGKLGITRLRANRLLGEARESGLVNIQVNARLADCVELERQLVHETGLKDAVVVPTPTDQDQIAPVLGRATADYLARHLGETRVRGLGIGWGTTLRETIRHLHAGNFPELSINSMMGGLTHGLELNTFEIASEFARRINGQCNYLAAPIYAGSPRSRDTILDQDVFQETFQRLATNDVALLSVGDLSRRSLLIRYGLPRDVTVDSLRAAGAVGDIMGTFLDFVGQAREACGQPARDRSTGRDAARHRHVHRRFGRLEQDGDPGRRAARQAVLGPGGRRGGRARRARHPARNRLTVDVSRHRHRHVERQGRRHGRRRPSGGDGQCTACPLPSPAAVVRAGAAGLVAGRRRQPRRPGQPGAGSHGGRARHRPVGPDAGRRLCSMPPTRPIRPALLWNDGRASAECADLHRCLEDFADIVGCRAMPGFSAPKLLWLTAARTRRHDARPAHPAHEGLHPPAPDRRGRERPRRRLGDAADGYRPRRLARRHPGGLRRRSQPGCRGLSKAPRSRARCGANWRRAGICRPARRWRAAAATTCARASAWARSRLAPPTSAWERRASTSSPTIASCRHTAAACTPIATPCRDSSPSMPSP